MSGRRFARLALAAVALVLVVPASSASAATQDLEFVNTGGSFAIGATELELAADSGGIAGQWDDVTGDFVGATEFNPITIPAAPPDIPVDVVINLNAASAQNVTGTIDPDTGDAALTAAMQIVIEIPALSITCTSPAFDVAFDSEAPGDPLDPLPFDPSSSYTMSLIGSFTVPTLELSACGAGNEAIAGLVNQTLGLPAEGDAVLPLVRGSVPPPPPTTPATEPTSSTTGTASTGAATAPRFTG